MQYTTLCRGCGRNSAKCFYGYLEPKKNPSDFHYIFVLFVWYCSPYDLNLIRQRIHHEAFVNYFLEQNQEYAFITEEEVAYRELSALLQQAIQELPERRREIFKLSRMESLSYKEISSKLGISENTIDTQIRHALAYLRDRIKS